LGAKPVFCDVEPDTLNVSAESIRRCLSDKTRAVIVVHMGGLAVDMPAIAEVLPPGVAVVEDAAHAFGSRYRDGRPVGSSGHLVCFSFYANKNLSTGEGGAISSTSGEVDARIRSLRLHGLPMNAWQRFSNARVHITPQLTELGYKMNYTDLQAAIGRVQLTRMAEFGATRQTLASAYLEALPEVVPGISFQTGVDRTEHAKHLFLCLLPSGLGMSRDDLLLELRKRNVGASLHYQPLHHMPLYSSARRDAMTNTDRIAERVLTLPISNSMTLDDVASVLEALDDAL
jgi:dTDP-4-amino-4,6-dideoxygalactose transaminase